VSGAREFTSISQKSIRVAKRMTGFRHLFVMVRDVDMGPLFRDTLPETVYKEA
jgi:hypothetical protein